jgi:3-oxoadipate enol-lactonase
LVRNDLRGFGRSAPATSDFSNVRDLLGLIRHLKLDRPLLVGSSMGGAIAIDFAVEHPEMVGGLFLAAPGISGFDTDLAPEGQPAYEADERQSKEIASAWSSQDTGRAFELLRQLWCRALAGPALELFRRMVQENAAEVFGDRSMQHAVPIEPRAVRRVGTLHVPTRVLVGDQDNPAMAYFGRWIAQHLPGASFVTVPGADHLINLSQPAAFTRELRGMLSRPTS